MAVAMFCEVSLYVSAHRYALITITSSS
ncbi:MAG: hypothetical protein RL707_1869, partial [Pseudomonadota bacterium]